MRYLVCLLALVAAVPAVVADAVAADGEPKKALTKSGQTAARSIVLKRADLGAGFTATKRPDDEPLPKGARCDALDEGDLTVTGDANSPDFRLAQTGIYVTVGSSAHVYRTLRDANASWQRGTSQQVLNCLGDIVRLSAAQGQKITVVSSKRVSFPTVAPKTSAYRVVVTIASAGSSQRIRAYVDAVVLQRGRCSPSCSSPRSAGRSPRPRARPSPRSWRPGWPARPAPAGRSPELTPRTRDNPPNGWVRWPPRRRQLKRGCLGEPLGGRRAGRGRLARPPRRDRGRAASPRSRRAAGRHVHPRRPRRSAPRSRATPTDDDEARVLLLRGLRSAELDVRMASVTALASLGHRYEWAVDGLIEALADDRDSPIRVASALDDLAPRPGVRLVPLLRHPSVVVRFSVVRLLARYPDLSRRYVAELTRDPSHQVRAAALETLRGTATAEAVRCATALLDDPHPLVRAQAAATAAAVTGGPSAALLVPLLGDESWAVRDATREALVGAGHGVADAMLAALDDPNEEIRSGAALVLQDVGVVDHLAHGDRHGHLERILDAGGDRLRQAASGRARKGVALGVPVIGAETA